MRIRCSAKKRMDNCYAIFVGKVTVGSVFFLSFFAFSYLLKEKSVYYLWKRMDGTTVDSRSSLFRIFVPCFVLVERSSLTKQVGKTYFKRRVVELLRFS